MALGLGAWSRGGVKTGGISNWGWETAARSSSGVRGSGRAVAGDWRWRAALSAILTETRAKCRFAVESTGFQMAKAPKF